MPHPRADTREALARVVEKRERCRALGLGTTHHDFDFRYTWFPPPISEVELERHEAYFRVRLPDEYRAYLLQVANGGAGPTFYPLGSLLEVLAWSRDSHRPFPLHGTWLRHAAGADPSYVESCRQQLVRGGFIEADEPIDAFIYPLPDGADSSDGTLCVGESGCGLDEELVLDGPYAGQVWHTSDGGAAKRADGFLQFIEAWLDAELARTTPPPKQAIPWESMSDEERVRRVYYLLSRLEDTFTLLLDQRLRRYTRDEYIEERRELLSSGIFDWSLRLVTAEAERAMECDMGATSVGLAAFYFSIGRTTKAMRCVERSKGSAHYDAILHGRIAWALGSFDEARAIFQAYVSSHKSPPRRGDGELWYFGEMGEVERRYDGEGDQASRLAVAHRYLGEHSRALDIGREASGTWAMAERAANLAMQGRTSEAIAELHAAIEEHLGLDEVARDPLWREVQEHPGFGGLIAAYTT